LKSLKLQVLALPALAILLVLGVTIAHSAGRDIYPEPSQAKADIAAAMQKAAQAHKRVILDFGGNWCGDCQVLHPKKHLKPGALRTLSDPYYRRFQKAL